MTGVQTCALPIYEKIYNKLAKESLGIAVEIIKNDLSALGIKHDNFVYESKLIKNALVQKVRGIKELSLKFLNKSFNPDLIKNMNNEEAIIYLSTLRQIGRWSAEMILIFTFNRENIWPIQDIGLLRAISNNYKKNIYLQEIL